MTAGAPAPEAAGARRASPAGAAHPWRAAPLFLSAIIGLSLVGYLVGIGQSRHSESTDADRADPVRLAAELGENAADGVVPSLAYADLRTRRIGPNRGPTPATKLTGVAPDALAEVVIAPGDKQRALAERSALRAYNGAPPTIPHAIEAHSDAACLGCHEAGLVVDDRRAAPLPHSSLTNCTQCHVAELRVLGAPEPLAPNSFAGLPAPTEGARAWPGAPPEIPHTTHMRENCLACHGVLGKIGLRTTHPWRQSCLQCHAPSASLERLPWGDAPGSAVRSPP